MLHSNLTVSSEGHLLIGGVDCVALAAEYGTPLYVLDEDMIRSRCKLYLQTMKKHFGVDSMPFYASKALSFLEIYGIVNDEGLGTDIVSPGELYTALEAGFPADKMCFHGNNKTDEDIRYAISSGIGYIVVDCTEELYAVSRIAGELGTAQKILIRITPGIDPHTQKAITTGMVDSKFGSPIDTGAAEKIVKTALSLPDIELCGYHCHIGSQIWECEPFCRAGKIMVGFSALIKKKYGYEAEIINLGGGFGVKYIEEQPEIDIDEYIGGIAGAMRLACNDNGVKMPRVFMEPGRGIVGAAGLTLYTVGSRKEIEGYRNYVSIDGGMPDNPRYALYRSAYTTLLANKAAMPADYLCTVCGRCCESGDLIAEDILMQKAERGDILATLVTGAYNYSMASNYNRIPRPPIVFVKNGISRLSVRRESYEDLLRNERILQCYRH